jgi:hypothetical protein
MPWINLTVRRGTFTREKQHAVMSKLESRTTSAEICATEAAETRCRQALQTDRRERSLLSGAVVSA